MYAVVRVRGKVDVKRQVEDTLRILRLDGVNSCVIIPEDPVHKGMLNVAKDWITYGEIDKVTLVETLKKRLRLKGNDRLDENSFKKLTGKSFEEFADELIAGKVKLKDFKELQPLFRLTPPSHGFKSVKEHYPKGDLGYRGKEINELLIRMI